MVKKNISEAIRQDEAATVWRADEIEHRPLASIKPYKRNAKRHPPEQIALLKRVVEKHGFDVPIVVDGKGVIIKGHGRWMAAKELGLATVPTIVRRDLAPAAIAEARLADNRVGEYGWDFEALVADVVGNLKAGLDVDLIGFSLKELGLEKTPQPMHDEIGDNESSSETENEKNDTGEFELGEGAHTCPRCKFNFD